MIKKILQDTAIGLAIVSLLVLPMAPVFAQQYYYGTTSNYNVAPIWKETRGPNLSVPQGQTLTTTFEAEDYNNDFLIYNSVQLPAGASFNPATRVFTFTPSFNQLGSFPVVLSVTDNKSAPVTKTFYVSVTANTAYGSYYPQYPYGNNQAPYFTATQSYYDVRSGSELRFTLRATDPNSDPIYFSATGIPAGAVFNQYSGEFVWTARSEQRGIYTVRFTAHDQTNASVALSVTIVVDGGAHHVSVVAPSGQTIATYTSGGVYVPEPEVGGLYYGAGQPYYPAVSSVASTYYPSGQVPPKITYKTQTTEKINYVYVDRASPSYPSTSLGAGYPVGYTAGAVLINAGRVVPTYPVTTAGYNTYTAGSYGSYAGALSTFNIALRAQENGQMSVTWDTSKPATSEIVFGYASYPRSDNWNVILNYDFTTGENDAPVTRHQMSLGKLELGRTYYMRVISRLPTGQAGTDRQTDISREIAFIPMQTPDGPVNIGQYDDDAYADYTATSVITSTGLLTVLALIAAGMIIYLILQAFAKPRYRRKTTTTTTTEVPQLHIDDHSPTDH